MRKCDNCIGFAGKHVGAYAEAPTGNIYLTLAGHLEDDETIWRRCAACAPEFPDLAILRKDRS